MPPYLRHPDGRGKLFGDAEANAGTYIDRTSSAHDFAKLRDCRLERETRVRGRSQVYGGTFRGTEISGSTVVAGSPLIVNSEINCFEVSGHPAIFRSRLLGGTEVCDRPSIKDSVLQDAIVYGSAHICACSGNVTGRVHEGVWTRPPKHIKLPWGDLSECVDGKMLLNCYCRPVVWWLKFGRRIAAKWDWSTEMIEVTLGTISREFLPQLGQLM